MPHASHVDTQGIRAAFSCDRALRLKLEIPFIHQNKRDETVAIVMKNPSSADQYNADTTIRRVEEYVYRSFRSAARLTVVNLLAYRATAPGDVEATRWLSGLDSIVGEGNNAAITAAVQTSDHVILGWGAPSGIDQSEYERRIRQVAEILQPNRPRLWHVGKLTFNSHPRHPLQWGYASPKKRLPTNWPWWPRQ